MAKRMISLSTSEAFLRAASIRRYPVQPIRGDLVTVRFVEHFVPAVGKDLDRDTLMTGLCIVHHQARHTAIAADRIAPEYRHLRREIASVNECLDWFSEGRTD